MHRVLSIISLLVGALALSAIVSAQESPALEHADLVLRGGTIVTVDDAIGEVQALAARGDRIVAVGSDEQIAAHIGPATTIVELHGRLAIPGFIEGHGHFVGLGEMKMTLNLMHVRNWDEVVAMVAEAVKHAKPGEWIVGRGWHQEKWDRVPPESVEGFPTHASLSDVSPDNPVRLTHASGHASFVNRRAMEESGISGATPDPLGGDILRDLAGEPTGLFRQNAQQLIRVREASMSPRAQYERLDRTIDLAIAECLANGITSFHDAGLTFPVIDRLAERARSGTLGVRLWVMMRTDVDQIETHAERYAGLQRLGADRLTVGGIKFAIDGALGSRGAWLLEPYEDSPESAGFNTTPLETIERAARVALAHDLQLCIHAIGDRANRETLDLFERSFREHERSVGGANEGANDDNAASAPTRPGRERRWRIEHAQHLHPDDIVRFAPLGVIASMQGIHCVSDGPWVSARLGRERARQGAYVWRSLIDSGAVVTNGSDAPVEPIDPILSFHASITRELPDGTIFFPQERMTRMEALRSYTILNAYAAFEEDIKGSLTPGKLADIVVLSQNILSVPPSRILEARVDVTILGGRIVHQREQSGAER